MLILLLPVQLGKHFWPDWSMVFGIRVDYLAPTIYLTDVVAFLMFIFWFRENISKLKKVRTIFPAVAFFLFLLLTSLFVAKNQGAAIYKLIKLVEFFLLGLYVSKNKLSVKSYRLISLSVIYSSLIAIAQFLKQSTLGGVFWWLGERTFSISAPGITLFQIGGKQFLRPYATFPHPNVLAGFILLSLALIAKRKTSKFNFLTLITGAITLFLTFSKSVWLTAVVILGLTTLTKKQKMFNMGYKTILVLIFVFSLVTPFLPNKFVRVELAQSALGMVKKSFLTGVGLNNFIVRLPEYSQEPEVAWFLQPVHNVFLLVASEAGVVILFIFLWFLFLTFKKLKKVNELNHKLKMALLVILLTGVFDHYWLTLQQTQLFSAIVFGMIWSKKWK